MRPYRLSPAAQRDLSEIWDFTEERWDRAQAERYVADLRAAIERIANDRARGRPCDEVREGYRRYGIGSHLIFYIETDEIIDVIRIPHQRMDPLRHL